MHTEINIINVFLCNYHLLFLILMISNGGKLGVLHGDSVLELILAHVFP